MVFTLLVRSLEQVYADGGDRGLRHRARPPVVFLEGSPQVHTLQALYIEYPTVAWKQIHIAEND